jgi:hypothetical protein
MLTKCSGCGGLVSIEAVSCPKCGHPLKRTAASHSRIIVWGSIFLVLVLVYFLMNARLF